MEGRPRTRAQITSRNQHVEATRFLYTIVETAERIKSARDFGGSPALRFDPQWSLLRAIERCGGCPSFADVGRALRITRQAARDLALAAEESRHVEFFPDPHDRRVIQVTLTPAGRRTLERHRYPDLGWIFTLLNGLEPDAMCSTAHVLRVIGQRLDRYAADLRARRSRVAGRF